MSRSPQIDGVLEACLYAEDLDAAEKFYTEVLGLELYSEANGRDLFFRVGKGMFLLFNPARTENPDSGVPAHGARGAGHVAFSVSAEDLNRWRERLKAHGVPIELELTWPTQGRSIYFRDPAGNSVELATPQVWNLG